MSKINRREQAIEIIKPKTEEDFKRMQPVEMCTCGHFRKEHSNIIIKIKGINMGEIMGHGKCGYGGMNIFCPCKKFTWNGKWSI